LLQGKRKYPASNWKRACSLRPTQGEEHMNTEEFYDLYREYLSLLDDTEQNSILITDRANADDVLWKFYSWLKEKNQLL
jgi:hypothetical protein